MENQNNLSFDPIRIRQIREFRNLSQGRVAHHLGISQSSYNDLEQGRTKIKADTLGPLAQCLDIDIRCFFESQRDYRRQFALLDEKKYLEQACRGLREENEKLNEQLQEQKQLYRDYRKTCEELLANAHARIKTKRFYINILLFFSAVTLYTCLFVLYFEDLHVWFLSGKSNRN